MKTITLLNVNGTYYFNGDRITYQQYVELLNTGFATKDVLFSLYDEENNVVVKVKGI